MVTGWIFKPVRKGLSLFGLALLALSIGSCASVEYAGQAVKGQVSMLAKAKPVDKVIANPKTSEELKRKLRLTKEIRSFAKQDLGLKVKKQYSSYADLGRDAAVYTVLATPELSAKPKTWCYPIVGCLAYRGFFKKAAAAKYAAELEQQGFDVYWDGTDAYSTLGWLPDPLLNTFINDPDVLLAELLFHELTHSTLFVAGDTAFNESLGMAVQEIGVEKWLRSRGQSEQFAAYQKRLRALSKFRRLVNRTNKRLDAAFSQSASDRQKRALKKRIYASLIAEYEAMKPSLGKTNFDRYFYAENLNNAKLSAVGLYDRWVPAFMKIYQQSGSDLSLFFDNVEVISKLKKPSRDAYLERLQNL